MTTVASFYRFVDLDDPGSLRDRLQALCEEHELLGTVLVAAEGINGSLTGARQDIGAVLDWLGSALGLDEPIDARWTPASGPPFRRLRVRVKAEIVTLGRPDLRPQRRTGRHVSPEEWNALLDRPDTLVIDTRNHYEIEVGTFPNALDPGTASFRDFPGFAARLAAEDRNRPLAMFCTGGIRCEKATALMLELGFTEVNQLQGGILNYLDAMAGRDNRWNGECFVFDTRVAVDRDLEEGGYVQCHACRRPLSAGDLASPDYREGVSCPHCVSGLEDERARRLEERRRQVRLARERGAAHIGPAAAGRGKAEG
ncbi:MAG: rhodanese-related sulfurtransferase [Gammaproteobacteria bacterium]|nr:rhodanese-related sulfurtransferase [Gammaproteobacteria bacterium]MDH4253104.1 rhodanese-related sulfurtransferase [Gammaproteobacteria bacterium]MDH5308930.1 rhodanese-related sulfurtransferase [Gammaproteobacteria bacterium]